MFERKTKVEKGSSRANTSQNTSGYTGNIDPDTDRTLTFVGKILWGATILLLLLVALFTSVYTLDEEEYAVVFTMGKPSQEMTAGIKFKLPFFSQKVTVPKGVLKMAIGYDPETNASIERESTMITSDFNFINADFYTEYRVADPVQAVINKKYGEVILKNLAQSYIRDTIGVYTVDDVLTSGKMEVQNKVEEQLKSRMLAEELGWVVEKVNVQDVELPTAEVSTAFSEVENAKQKMSTDLNQAQKYQNEQMPMAEANADSIVKKAEAEKQQRINEANGQVERFNSMYAEYKKFPLITKKRIFYETIEEILPALKVIINNSDGTQTMLPLESFSTTTVNQTTETKGASTESPTLN